MKKYLGLLLLIVFVLSCQKKQKHTLSYNIENEKSAINSLLNNWHLAATEANFDNYFTKMDSVSVFIGTDASENWSKKEFENFSKPYFDRGKAWDFKTLERNIYLSNEGSFAWFDELLNTWMGTCRGSGVLEKNGPDWTIKHYVLSVTIPNDDIEKIIEVKQEKDSTFLSSFKK